MSKGLSQAVIASAIGLGLVGTAQAGIINWEAAQNVTSAGDIVNAGTTVEAFNGENNAGSTTINGVTFLNSNALLPLTTSGAFLAGNSSGDASLDALLNGLDFGGGPATSISIGNGALDIGANYLVQVFFTDLRSCCSNRNMTFGDGNGNTVTLNATGSGLGQFGVGRFVADGTSQTLTLAANSFGNAHITGYQLRAVPEPATLGLLAVGVIGAQRARRRRG